MWTYSSNEEKWNKKVSNLDKRTFNYLREEIEDMRYYSKCLDGTTYVNIQDTSDIYDVLSYKQNTSYKIGTQYSSKYNGSTNIGIDIKAADLSEDGMQTRYNTEYGFTLKNLFSPNRLIDTTSNYNEVDVATTESIDLDNIDPNSFLVIDNVTLLEGHRVLVKDNVSSVTLESSVVPEEYFGYNYTITGTIGTSVTYQYKNVDNGIYRYTNGNLIRETDLATYSNNIRYSVYVKLGNVNKEKEYHLSRLKSGHYPISDINPIEFIEKENNVIRNKFQYRNVLDNQFNKGLYQAETTFTKDNLTYRIPERFISVGDFGFVTNYQDNYVNIVKNKYKEDLKDIIELEDKYLSVGNNGSLYSFDKRNLKVDLKELNTFENLSSIAFSSQNNGVIVGENGTLIRTRNQQEWVVVSNINIQNNLNDVYSKNLNEFSFVGNNGLFYNYNITTDNFTKKDLVLKSDLYTSKVVLDDINSISDFSINSQRHLFNNNYIDLSKTIGKSNFSIDFIFKPMSITGSGTASQTMLSFLETSNPGLKLELVKNVNWKLKLTVTSDTNTEIEIESNINIENNKWYHIFITRNLNTYNLYVNNQNNGSTSLGYSGNFSGGLNRIRLGGSLSGTVSSGEYFNGVIDDLRLWNKNLDSKEVSQFYNNYGIYNNLQNWYKFNVENSIIRTQDIVSEIDLISYSSITDYNISGTTSNIDTETYNGDILSSDNYIIISLDLPNSYSNLNLTDKFFIEKSSTKTLQNGDYIYGIGSNVFRYSKSDIFLNVFNNINLVNISSNTIIDDSYQDIIINSDTIYLVGSSDKEIDSLSISSLCPFISTNNPLENCSVYATVSLIGTTNSITIENDYRNDIFDVDNTSSVHYIKTLGFPGSTQSVLDIPLLSPTGSSIELYKEFYLSFEVEDLINGSFELSMDQNVYNEVSTNGTHLIKLVMGNSSKLTIRAKLSSSAIGNKVKGTLKNFVLYEADCVQIGDAQEYSGTTENVKKFYFTQFDTDEQLAKLNTSIYSYLDIKSLKIDDIEQIGFVTYSNSLPIDLMANNFSTNALVDCSGVGLCEYIPSLSSVVNRINYGFGLNRISSSEYDYINDSYGLLEAFTFNNTQIFGQDTGVISNGTTNINNPIYMGIDLNKDFYFEVESRILKMEDNLLDDNIKDKINATTNIGGIVTSVPSGSSYFNLFDYVNLPNTSQVISLNSTLETGNRYYLEADIDTGGGLVQISIGGNFLSYNNVNGKIKETLDMYLDASSMTIYTGTASSISIESLIITDRPPTKSVISWDKSKCELKYNLNGYDQTNKGFLLEDGSGEYTPTCQLSSSVCSNTTTSILSTSYWDKYDPKLLFLDYDIASKLYFFDTDTSVYNLPQEVTLSDINKLELKSITGQLSWLDYSKDILKEFQYDSVKNDSNEVKYSSLFELTSASSSYTTILNGNSTNSLSDINGATYGLLPNFSTGTVSIGTPSVATYSNYFYNDYYIIKAPTNFTAEIGDIIRIENAIIEVNSMVVYKLTIGSDTYIYLKSKFNQGITNKLKNWTKATTITNLNLYRTQNELIANFNNHPISSGYLLTDNGTTLTVSAKYNAKTAYYNMQINAQKTDTLLNVTNNFMKYENKILSFKYLPTYNILDYLSLNSNFTSNYELGSLPSYRFSNSNAGVLYTLSNGKISFNSSLKTEWESIPLYTFVDIDFGSTKLSSVLIMGKSYDATTNRYILQTYNYYEFQYDQSDFNASNWTLRVRNKLSEISSDLNKLNNIQKSASNSYNITDLDNEVYTSYTTYKKELDFKPNTDSYAKAFLNSKEIKEYLTGIVYTDDKNDLATQIINLSEERNLTITAIDKYLIDCDNCTYDSYTTFTDPVNSQEFNSYQRINNVDLYSQREPFSTYNYYNQINLIGATGSTSVSLDIDFITQSGQTRTVEFKINELENAVVKVYKGATELTSISTVQSELTKLSFSDNGNTDLRMLISYSPNNRVKVNNIRVGNESCLTNCYLTKLVIPNHELEVGDYINLDLNQTIYELVNLYESDFISSTVSNWELDGVEAPLTNNFISVTISTTGSNIYYNTPIGVTAGNTYRLTFEYKYNFISGTPSITPAFGLSSSLATPIDNSYSTNGDFFRVESNFIANTSSIYVGFNAVGNGTLRLKNISVDQLVDQGEYYDGFQVVNNVIDENNIVINVAHKGNIEQTTATYSAINKCGNEVIKTRIISNVGEMTQFVFDPYLNFAPIDIYKLGTNDKINKAVEIKPNNWVENNDETVSLVNVDYTNYRFMLIDNLSLTDLSNNYSWLLEAEIRNAIIGKNNEGIVWYSGIWDCGRWFGSVWNSGIWRNGEWYKGEWNDKIVVGKLNPEISDNNGNEPKSLWYSGNFRKGTWNGGKWLNGNFRKGTWNKGEWLNGTFTNGTWNSGNFKRGSWINGTWNSGTFNCELGQSYWFNGNFFGGIFQCGIWYNGLFESKNETAIFGLGSSSSRKAIWHNGTFLSGEFNSGTDNTNHSFSEFRTGKWISGTFNGGTIYQADWNKGVFNNGIVKSIPVVSFVGENNTFFFTLKGDWKFSVNDIFYIINNNTYNTLYGTNDAPVKYKVDQDYITVNNGEYTKVVVEKVNTELNNLITTSGSYVEGYVDNNNPSDATIDDTYITNIVSDLNRIEWHNGQLENGIIEGDFFRNGIVINGVIKNGTEFGY
jgi:hypothetical protein